MIKCPNCQTELFRAEKLKSESGIMTIRLTCAKCGHRIQVWIENTDLKELAKRLESYNKLLEANNKALLGLLHHESRSWWRKLLGARARDEVKQP